MKQIILKLIQVLPWSPQEKAVLPEKTLMEVFREFNKRDAVQNLHAPKTVQKYENFADNLERYLKQNQMADLPVSKMKISILEGFHYWLHENLSSCCKTHSSKHIERCKKVMNYATRVEYVPFSTIAAYKTRRDADKDVINLESDEFKVWVSAKWHIKAYQDTQDNYAFQVVTGVSYMDLYRYKTREDETGLWIEATRGKRGKSYWVPLFHPDFALAKAIHEKHSGKLPHIENGVYNRQIREMAAILGIEKYLTSHTGRKTFATLKDQKGWSTPSIAAVLGNTEAICRKHYIKPSRKKIEAELARLA